MDSRLDEKGLLLIHEQKLKDASEEVVSALRARDDAQIRLDKANLAANAWRTIVVQERERLGVPVSSSKELESRSDSEDEINRVDWTHQALIASSDKGLIPPEVYRLAQRAGVTMNRNYPYVVLSKLVERGLATKRGARYYGKEAKK